MSDAAMISFGDLYSGGGGAALGALAAGLTPIWGIELDPTDEKSERFSHAAADCYEANISAHVIRVPVEDVDPHSLPPVEALHASPVCVNFSVANKERGEKNADKVSAAAVCRFLRVMKPRIFTLENVEGYAKSEAFGLILSCLEGMGYFVDYAVLNAASFGVPQTRRRLILRAVYGSLVPLLPPPTRWVGWYEAIEDLIPTLPESRFADWQIARLPHELTGSLLAHPNADNPRFPAPTGDKPAFTIATFQAGMPRAFLLSNAATEYSDGVPNAVTPAFAVTGESKGRVRAFLVDDYGNTSREPTVLDADSPSMTMQAWHGRRPCQAPRAFIMDGRNTRTTTDEPFTLRAGDEPCFTICAADGSERNRAFVDGLPPKQTRLFETGPAWLSQGRVVSMSPRALGRFQAFPDWYVFPAKPAVATQLIGNAIPPLLMQRIYEGLCPEATDAR